MKYKNIILTGGSGKLGKAILTSGILPGILSPTHRELDITGTTSLRNYFIGKSIDAVIHCAAFTSMPECEKYPEKAITTNVVGTTNLVNEVLKKQTQERDIRFLHLSTDAVYSRDNGNYSETSPTIPNSVYGWSKLGAECAVNALKKNYCILRTSFFDPLKLNFPNAPDDVYTSKIAIDELVKAIKLLLESDFKGTINVGNNRVSNYELFKKYIPNLRPCKLEDIKNSLPFPLPKDSSMDVSLWERIKSKQNF